jgi:hypothetical protein
VNGGSGDDNIVASNLTVTRKSNLNGGIGKNDAFTITGEITGAVNLTGVESFSLD